MKKRLLSEVWSWCMCLTSMIILSSCEPTLIDPCKEQTDNRILQFKEYCYDAAGNVRLAQPEDYADTEWMIPVETEAAIPTIFQQLTGLPLHSTEKYEFSYHSEDYRFVIRVVGQKEPINNKYVSLYLWIEGCPEIDTIHLATPVTEF